MLITLSEGNKKTIIPPLFFAFLILFCSSWGVNNVLPLLHGSVQLQQYQISRGLYVLQLLPKKKCFFAITFVFFCCCSCLGACLFVGFMDSALKG